MSVHYGIDLGGTRVKVLAVDAIGEILQESSAPTHVAQGASGLSASVREALAPLEAQFECVESVGICAPGLADPSGACIAWMPGRLQGLEQLNWAVALERPEGVPVLNDAQAALLGEVWQGAARGCRDVLLLTLGTGVGGAILANGEILRGKLGRAGHVGHLSIRPEGALGITGLPGTLEQTLSESAFAGRFPEGVEDVQGLLHTLDSNAAARALWEQSIQEFGRGLAGLINVLDPDRIVLGGGVSNAGEALLAPLRAALDTYEWRPGGACVDLALAELGERAGAFGAAREGMLRLRHQPTQLPS
ncbi:MAG: ROK family protein [Opitutales bacterium]